MEYLEGWRDTPMNPFRDYSPRTSVSVIIAAYNEEETISGCIHSILANDYPRDLVEVIVVDNGSNDKTREILRRIDDERLKIVSQIQGNKKESIEKGIEVSKGDFLLLTDADCKVGDGWIKSMVYQKEKRGADCVLGPVKIGRYNNLQTRFEAFDMLAMMGITCGGLKKEMSYLSNGANFAYSKDVFNKIQKIPRKGYASGDDVMTLHEIVKLSDITIRFQKDEKAVITTFAQKSWSSLIQQRIRWASKATSYVHKKDVFVNAFVFFLCVSIVVNIGLTPFTGGVSFLAAIFQLFIKGVIDYAFLDHVNQFFRQKHLKNYFLPSFFVHIIYIVFTGFTSIFRVSYRWKGKVLR